MVSVAFGPKLPDFGSWQWVGADLCGALRGLDVLDFNGQSPPADIVVFVKFLPSLDELREAKARSALVYFPVDYFGSCAEIDRTWESLRLCDVIVVHSQRLQAYFQSYATTIYLDHHLKFVSDPDCGHAANGGPILWVGVHSNLPPLVEWVNAHDLPADLVVLTNRPDDRPFTPGGLGFSARNRVLPEPWSRESHLAHLKTAGAALDIKGDDFRSRHKPPAKALDFIASGLPLAMNKGTAPAEHLRRVHGFDVVDPADADRWLSVEYRQETIELGQRLRQELSLESVASRFSAIISSVQEAQVVGT